MFRKADRKQYHQNMLVRRASERTLQLSAEACLDIGRRIIAGKNLPMPDTNREIFIILSQEGLIEKKLSDSLARMEAFRNLLVHDYAHIDDDLVFEILQESVSDLEDFAISVSAFLESA